ncbi:MAG: hypothetical protein HOJ67_04630 [Rhodospirillaceae bacterium]|nr:hypothetical protein [Rhodospirillaceae bacterium]
MSESRKSETRFYFTDAALKTIKSPPPYEKGVPETGPLDYFDEGVKRLVFRASPTGERPWMIKYSSPTVLDAKGNPKQRRFRYPRKSWRSSKRSPGSKDAITCSRPRAQFRASIIHHTREPVGAWIGFAPG